MRRPRGGGQHIGNCPIARVGHDRHLRLQLGDELAVLSGTLERVGAALDATARSRDGVRHRREAARRHNPITMCQAPLAVRGALRFTDRQARLASVLV